MNGWSKLTLAWHSDGSPGPTAPAPQAVTPAPPLEGAAAGDYFTVSGRKDLNTGVEYAAR